MTTDMQALKTQIEDFRSQTVATLKRLSELMAQSQRTQAPSRLQERWAGLDKNNYLVLVLGKVNRGKSSFINALLGRELLPVDVTITTSQIYCIRSAQKEAYRLRYESAESQKTVDISVDEFREYGTQVPDGQRRILRHSLKELHWIEADIPTPFLPEGIALLDTPGFDPDKTLKLHTDLTEKFLPQADAAIFLLSERTTVLDRELYWIERILQTTSLIFFVLPTVDRANSDEDWPKIMKRHKEELGKKFGSRLSAVQIWPFSSKALLAAVSDKTRSLEEKQRQKQIEILLKVSRQAELVDALTVFLFKAAGIDRCATALIEACLDHEQAKEKLQNSLATLENGSQSEDKLLEAKAEARQREERLQKAWGPDGEQRERIFKSIQELNERTKERLRDLSKPGGDLETIFRKKINAAKSISAINDLGKSLFDEVDQEWEKQLRKINKEFQESHDQIVYPLAATMVSPNLKLPGLSGSPGEMVKVEMNLVERLKQLQEGFIKGEVVGKAITAAVLTHVLFPVTLPVTIFGVGVLSVWNAIQGWKDVADKQLQDAHKLLDDYLTQIIQDTLKNLWGNQDVFQGKCQVDHYMDLSERESQKQIIKATEKLLAEARDKCVTLEKQINSNKQERAAHIQALKQQLAAWQELDAPMQERVQQLDTIQNIFTTLSTPREHASSD